MTKYFPAISTGVAVLFIVLMLGCSAAHKLKRAEKLINKAEELGAKWHTKTVYVQDTVIITETRVDSTMVLIPGDTVTLEKERLKVVIRRLRGDTIFVDAKCAADTVIKKVPVTVVKTLVAKSGIPWWWILIALVAGTFLGTFVMKALLG